MSHRVIEQSPNTVAHTSVILFIYLSLSWDFCLLNDNFCFWWLGYGHTNTHILYRREELCAGWLGDRISLLISHVVAAVMWHDVRGCWCYAPLQHKAGYYRTMSLYHPLRSLGSSPVNHCSAIEHFGLSTVCAVCICQSQLLSIVFGKFTSLQCIHLRRLA